MTPSNYFDLNNWVLPFYKPAATQFEWRKMTNKPPQFVLITEYEHVQIPRTTLDVFRIDLPSEDPITPELYAWPVRGVPCAIISSSYESRLKAMCFEYHCPLVELYQLEHGELIGPNTYPEISPELECVA